MGCRAFAHSRRTRSSVSSPESVVRSMQEIARRCHAACHSFFTVRRATCVCALRSTALVFTRTCFTQSTFSGMPRFDRRGCPESIAKDACESGATLPAAPSFARSATPKRFLCSADIVLPCTVDCTAEGQLATVFCYSFVPRSEGQLATVFCYSFVP